ncbi:hypothetical protein OE88DRAFT_319222 [Heliocybe sulcata]|uniref:Uncharacterized protein n=1 Tax=Heliocybe sulcata TaxID=5364 RepID=A0A5C3MYU0_9AGAM|nr:hypothetical protein OE88DRAFT_319222 [Heliocybe sulcata]
MSRYFQCLEMHQHEAPRLSPMSSTSMHSTAPTSTLSALAAHGAHWHEEAHLQILQDLQQVGPPGGHAILHPTTALFMLNFKGQIFSPPPPVLDLSDVPPVPRLPPHLASQASLPMRRRPPPFPGETAGVVRPSAQPLPFEANLGRAPPHPPHALRIRSPPMAAAPPSHHQPNMGFGGAILALNRQAAIEAAIANNAARHQALVRQRQRAVAARDQAERRTWNLPSLSRATGFFVDMFRGFTGNSQEDAHMDDAVHDIHDWMEFMGEFGVDEDRGYRHPEGWGLFPPAARPRPPDVEYKPEYTHSGKPESGYTFDFSPPASTAKSVIVIDDSPGPSGSSSTSSEDPSNVLVCAHCLDPLTIGSGADTSEDGQKQRRVWALRCGHILDGKCIETLMKPPSEPEPEPEPVQEEVKVDVKGKGKSRATEASESEVSSTARGKRKAKADPEPEQTYAAAEPEDNSIRSRLRSRHRTPVAPPPPGNEPPAADSSSDSLHIPGGFHSRPFRPLPRRRNGRAAPGPTSAPARGGRGKGKGKAKQPAVEREWEWRCPVLGCGRVHNSLLVEGKWVVDAERGPIALYV